MNKTFEERKGSVKILHEDEFVVAVSKPGYMIVNRSDTAAAQYTLQDWVDDNINLENTEAKESNKDFLLRSGIVHRLDKETSGILLIAKNENSFTNLQDQFKRRTIEKTYLALCHGRIPDKGTISVPVGRLPWNRRRFGVVPYGREAVTEFQRVSFYKYLGEEEKTLSLVRLFPKTGRTHQIRVHLRYSGYPIFSDIFYAGRKQSKRDRKLLGRHFLHAEKITFIHPENNESMTIEAKLPDELDLFLKSLSKE